MPVCSLTRGARNGGGDQDQLRQVNSQWEAEMMRLVEQLDVAQQQLKQQLAGPGGAADPAEVARLKKQLADEAEDNDALSEQLVVLDSDHQKLQEKNEALVKENEVFRKENERLLKLNGAVGLMLSRALPYLCTGAPRIIPRCLVLLTSSLLTEAGLVWWCVHSARSSCQYS